MKLSTRFRNSQLRLLPQCGWAYREAYVRGTEGIPSPSLTAGRNVHAAVALAIREVVKGGMWLDVHQLAYQAVRGGDIEYADALDVITKITESLADEGGLRIDPKQVFLLEEMLETELELSDGTKVVFYGTPDLVERVRPTRARITDWKTHWHPESQEEFEADPQLERYALLVGRHYPAFEEFHLVKRFVRYRNNVREKTITRADFPRIEGQLIAEIETARAREAADDFEATGGSWCGLCEYHHTCPLIARYRDAGADLLSIPSDDVASELAGAAVALDAAARRLKQTVKRYLGSDHASGRVPVAGGSYGFGPTKSRELSYQTAAEIFARYGVEIPPALARVDLRELDRLSRRLPEGLVSALEEATTVVEKSQCRFRADPKVAASNPPEPAFMAEELF